MSYNFETKDVFNYFTENYQQALLNRLDRNEPITFKPLLEATIQVLRDFYNSRSEKITAKLANSIASGFIYTFDYYYQSKQNNITKLDDDLINEFIDTLNHPKNIPTHYQIYRKMGPGFSKRYAAQKMHKFMQENKLTNKRHLYDTVVINKRNFGHFSKLPLQERKNTPFEKVKLVEAGDFDYMHRDSKLEAEIGEFFLKQLETYCTTIGSTFVGITDSSIAFAFDFSENKIDKVTLDNISLTDTDWSNDDTPPFKKRYRKTDNTDNNRDDAVVSEDDSNDHVDSNIGPQGLDNGLANYFNSSDNDSDNAFTNENERNQPVNISSNNVSNSGTLLSNPLLVSGIDLESLENFDFKDVLSSDAAFAIYLATMSGQLSYDTANWILGILFSRNAIGPEDLEIRRIVERVANKLNSTGNKSN